MDTPLDFDEALLYLGGRGRYQLFIYYLLCVPAAIPAAWLAYSQIFLSATPDHWCWQPALGQLELPLRKSLAIPTSETSSSEFSKCSMYDVNFTEIFHHNGHWPQKANYSWPVSTCKYGWEYDRTDYDETLVTEFNLVCESSWWPATGTACFYAGSVFGNLIFGWIADRWGRKISFFMIYLLQVTFSIGLAFSPDYMTFTTLRTIAGLSFPSDFQIPFILVMELMGPEYRTYAGMVVCVIFASAMASLAGLAYFVRHWHNLALTISVPFVALFSYWWIIPESPRWLLSKGRVDEAEVIVQKMAKWNNKKIPTNFLRKLQSLCHGTENKDYLDTSSLWDLVRNPNIRKKILIITFTWLVNSVVYNGLNYNASNLGVSDYLGFFIGGVVEIPSYFICWWAMDTYGRRWVLCITMVVGGLTCISCGFVPGGYVWVTVSLAMAGKFCTSGSFAVLYVFGGELLPTVLRSISMGIASFVAGIGMLAFPYIVLLSNLRTDLPLIIFGILSLIGGFTSIMLPETLNHHLPQTVEEGEAFGKSFNIFSLPKRIPRASNKSTSKLFTFAELNKEEEPAAMETNF